MIDSVLKKTNGMIKEASAKAVNNILSSRSAKKISQLEDAHVSDVEIGKINQEALEKQLKNEREVRKLAEDMIKKHIMNEMEKAIKKLGVSGVTGQQLLEGDKDKVRAVIRGYMTSFFTQSELINNAISQTQDKLSDYLNTESKRLAEGIDKLNGSIEKGTKQIDDAFSKTQSVLNKLNAKGIALQNMNSAEMQEKIIQQMDKALKASESISSFCNHLDSSINNNKYLKTLNIKLNLSDKMIPVVKNIEKNIAAKLTSQIKPFIEHTVKQVQIITETVKTFEAQLKAAEQKLQAELKKYEDMAINYAQEYTQKLVSEISSKINISFDGVSESIGGFLGL